MVSYALMALCGVIALWQMSHSVRLDKGADRWAGPVFSGGLGLMVLLYRRDVIAAVDETLGVNSAALVRNIVLIVAFTALQFFYLRNIASVAPRVRRVGEIVALGVVAVVLLVSTSRVEPPATLSATPENLHDPAVLTFFFASTAYLIYACLTQIVWAVRDAPGLRRRGAQTFFATAACLAAGCFMYMLLLVWRVWHYSIAVISGPDQIPAGPRLPGLILIILSMLAMLLGVALPVVVADARRMARWVRDVLVHRSLKPLDEVISVLYPGMVRPSAPEVVTTRGPADCSRRSIARELRKQRCGDGYARLHNAVQGVAECSRGEVMEVVEVVRKIPGGPPSGCESGDVESLMRVSRWLRRNQVADAVAGRGSVGCSEFVEREGGRC